MLRSYLLVAGVAASSIALSAAAGCGGTDVTTGGGGSASTSGSGAPVVHKEPPAAGPMKATDGTTDVTFAIKKLYLGDTNRDGTANKVNGWKDYGYDLDGKVSTMSSTDVCKPRNNASPKNVYPDGADGIDNSFGKNILQIILGIAADASVKVNEGITKGSFTIMLSLGKLGTGADYNPIVTKLYGGGSLAMPPKFDGSDMWPVIPELLKDPKDITTAQVQFPQSYLTKNTWVSGGKGTIDLNLTVQGFTLKLTIASALVSMNLSEDHKSVTNGTIAGVLATDTLTSELKQVAGAFDPSLCMGPTIDSIISQIQQASDIMQDGTQDPTKTCDGISIGLGFDGALVQLGAIAPAGMGTKTPCPVAASGSSSFLSILAANGGSSRTAGANRLDPRFSSAWVRLRHASAEHRRGRGPAREPSRVGRASGRGTTFGRAHGALHGLSPQQRRDELHALYVSLRVAFD